MLTYKIHLIRTGATSSSPGRRYTGQSDTAVCEEGLEALYNLKDTRTYPRVDMVYSSPLRRCLQTAGILYGNKRLEVIEDLKDMNLGSFQGKTFDELQGDPYFMAWLDNSFQHTPPGGEGTAAFTRRIVSAINHIFFRMMEDKTANVAVITHVGVIMTLLAAIGLPRAPLHQWAVDNGTGYTLRMTTQMWMRDGAAEVSALVPAPLDRDNMDGYGMDSGWDDI